jgi:L-fuculose-phosphate aldolase
MDSVFDLKNKAVITGRDIDDASRAGASEAVVRRGAVLTTTAREAVARSGIRLTTVDGDAAGAGPVAGYEAERVFNSPEARLVKEEIMAVGRKLWERGYVDGNGGNISFRISDRFVLCSPTLLSKGDIKPEDICMVDMAGNQVAGKRKATSEVKVHLAIFKAQPKAKSCVHAHPIHATAYSIVGKVPPAYIIPEAELFIGIVAFAGYETPGTKEIAEQVVPLCKDHNTILMANHGIICWSDSVTHAEWLVEVLDNYCATLILASQLGAPITRITAEQSRELMDIKKKLDLPDPRFSGREAALSDVPENSTSIIVEPSQPSADSTRDSDIDSVVKEITDKVMKALENRG